MKAIDQYRRHGLERPIAFRAGIWFHLLLWGGGSFLLLGCLVGLARGGFRAQAVVAFGLLFFGAALGIMLVAWFRSKARGLLELSKEGVYLSHIGIVLPWEDIGPAWISNVTHAGGTTKDVLFLLQNTSQHKRSADALGRLLLNLSKGVSGSKAGDGVDWSLRALLLAIGATGQSRSQFARELEKMRNSLAEAPDATVFNMPVPLRPGISAEDLVGILNSEVARRRGILTGDQPNT